MSTEHITQIVEAERSATGDARHRIGVCIGTGCLSAGADAVKTAISRETAAQDKSAEVLVAGIGCPGLCARGPLVTINHSAALYGNVQPDDAAEIVQGLTTDQSGGGVVQPVERLSCRTDTPLFERQMKIVLENAGIVDPERLESYVANGGYATLLDVITERMPSEVLEAVTQSGLRGRGGGGYSTGLKWNTVAKARRTEKYVICNGDEGDPGAFMDRAVMEGDPHRVLEGMAIAAYAVGASRGYLYVRAEYPLAVKRLKTAINRAERHEFLGANIGGSDFSFHVEVRLGAGAFVCGEETALIASIEGNRGTPRPRPPYPAHSGLFESPTLINNVETFANIVPILRDGAEWFASIGTEKSKGTKVFCLTGAIRNTGLIEVPMGITLREIVYDIGDGIPDGKKFKALQTGGPSGGCIPEQFLDLPVDYESLRQVGSIMGSGGMIVMDETSCMVDVAKFFMEFCKAESCGKCIPCRVGTAHMFDLLRKMTEGEATHADLALLERLCGMVRDTSLCGLGQSAPNPVLSTLKYFRDEYLAHIDEKRCPAGVCSMKNSSEVAAHA